jgi:hypothetical protein
LNEKTNLLKIKFTFRKDLKLAETALLELGVIGDDLALRRY